MNIIEKIFTELQETYWQLLGNDPEIEWILSDLRITIRHANDPKYQKKIDHIFDTLQFSLKNAFERKKQQKAIGIQTKENKHK